MCYAVRHGRKRVQKGYKMSTFFEIVTDLGGDLIRWIGDHFLEIFILAIIAAVSFGVYQLVILFPKIQAENIDLCVRAFEYTRDQCEFIVRNRIQVIKQ